MKNNTLKSILSSILVISLCISLIAGSTFALFTSESGVNIAVNAGKVDVVATIDEASLKTWSFNVEQEVGKFELGGTATVANGAINLSKMAPGDEAQVTIKTENNSDINIQYRVRMVTEGELAEALVATATINGIEYDMKTANATVWKSLVAGEQIGDIVVTIEFPNTDDSITDGTFDNVANNADNKYQGKEATAYIVIEAVQGNAQTTDSVINVTAANFAETLANLENDTTNNSVTLNLTEDVEWETGSGHGSTPLVSAKTGVTEIVIQGNGHTITATGAGVGSIRTANDGTLVFKNVNFVDESVSYAEDAWEFTYLEFAGKLVFENCTFNSGITLQSEDNEADAQVSFTNCKFKSEVASEYSVWVSDGKVSFTNCTFTGTRGLKTHEDYGSNVTSIVIDNCKFGPLSEKPGVVIGTLDATTNVTIKNNIFADVQAGDQSKYIYETDTDVTTFNFIEENNIVATTISTSDELDAAIKADKDVIFLGSGNFIIPDSAKGKTLTIIGNGETVVEVQDDGSSEGDCDYSFDGSTVTFENVTITTTATYFPGYVRMKGIYNNCTINGVWTLYDNSEFNGCTFNVSGDVYNVWTWGATEATFNKCTFNNDGKAILLYGGANTKLTVNECTFNDNGGLTSKKAAIEVGAGYGSSFEVNVNDTTVNGYEVNDEGINTGTTLWANKNSMSTENLNVVVDGVDVY